MLCFWLAEEDKVKLRPELLMAALTHDWAEQNMGDLPAPSKRRLPSYTNQDGTVVSFRHVWSQLEATLLMANGLEFESSLTTEEQMIVKVADAADGCLYCIRERMMGNKLVTPVYKNFRQYLSDISATTGSMVLESYIDQKWKEANRG